MRILVTGATGYIGRHIVQALIADHHDLVLTSRTPRQGAGDQDWRVMDFATAQQPDDWKEVVDNVELVINAVGILKQSRIQSFEVLHDIAPRALFEACKRAGVRRIIQISALGTDELATSDYHLSKKQADDALANLGVEWVVLRPSLIIGGSGESWRFFKALASLPLTPIIARESQILQPVPIDDVIKAVRASIHSPRAVASKIDIVGADSLTLKRYLQILSKWLGCKRFRPVEIPFRLAGVLAAGAWLFDDLPLNRQALSMLRDARPGEGADCREKLGFSPKGITDYLVRNPPDTEVRMASRLYFLRPALRLTLAFMWIMAGVVSLFFYPHVQSFALLGELGLTGKAGVLALYGAALLDLLIGLSLVMRFHIKPIAVLQIGLIVVYTLALSWVAPLMWSDPFGPLAKNIPIIVAILTMLNLEE